MNTLITEIPNKYRNSIYSCQEYLSPCGLYFLYHAEMEIKIWVKAARTNGKLTQEQLGDHLSVTKGNVSAWETGRHEPSWNQMLRISEITNFPLPAKSDQSFDANVEPGPDIKSEREYPVISFVQAGNWAEICDNFQPGDADEWLPCHKNLGRCGYILRVDGPSMTAPAGEFPTFPPGMLLYVNPELESRPGKFVIVRRPNTNTATFKKLIIEDGELYLEAINPSWAPRYIKLEEGDTFCGVVVTAGFDLS